MHDDRRTIREDARASIASALAKFYSELPNPEKQTPKFSVARAIQEMCSERGLQDGSYEAQVCRSLARMQGLQPDPHRAHFPFSVFRDLTAASTTGGGFLIPNGPTSPAVDLPRGMSILADAGATVLPVLVGNLAVPRISTRPTATWLTAEGTQATESQPVFGASVLTPKSVAIFTEISRQLLLQNEAAESVLRQQLLGSAMDALDVDLISGSGASGHVLGLLNVPGLSITSGAALSWTGIRAMRRAVIAAGAHEDRLVWIAGPDVQELLSGREALTGSGLPIWNNASIAGRPAFASASVPSATLLVADWSYFFVGFWGGLVLELDPFSGFTTGKFGARVIVSADAAPSQLGAFAASTGVT